MKRNVMSRLVVGIFLLFGALLFSPVKVLAQEQNYANEYPVQTATAEAVEAEQTHTSNDLSTDTDVNSEQSTLSESIEAPLVSNIGQSPTETIEETVEAKIDEDQSTDKQSTDYSCGPTALVIWIKLLGGHATEQELMTLAQTNAEEGTTFLNLRNAARTKGYTNATVYKLSLDNIGKLTLPALVYLNVAGSDIGHYAVLYKIDGDTFYLKDPIEGDITKQREDFITDFGEYAMINGQLIIDSVSDEESEAASDNATDQEMSNSVDAVSGNVGVANAQHKPAKKPIAVASDEELCQVKGKGIGGIVVRLLRPVVIVVKNTRVKVALHDPHHNFPMVGHKHHIQLTFYQKGVKGSGVNVRIPLWW